MMDPSQRTSGALLDRANLTIAQLLRRFENIIAYTAADADADDGRGGGRHEGRVDLDAAVGGFQMEVECAALVKAAEDILSLTRTLKEAWLFGKLQTIGAASDEEGRVEVARGRVARDLRALREARERDGAVGKEEGLVEEGDVDVDVDVEMRNGIGGEGSRTTRVVEEGGEGGMEDDEDGHGEFGGKL